MTSHAVTAPSPSSAPSPTDVTVEWTAGQRHDAAEAPTTRPPAGPPPSRRATMDAIISVDIVGDELVEADETIELDHHEDHRRRAVGRGTLAERHHRRRRPAHVHGRRRPGGHGGGRRRRGQRPRVRHRLDQAPSPRPSIDWTLVSGTADRGRRLLRTTPARWPSSRARQTPSWRWHLVDDTEIEFDESSRWSSRRSRRSAPTPRPRRRSPAPSSTTTPPSSSPARTSACSRVGAMPAPR